jgi:signal transduction histidine kinase
VKVVGLIQSKFDYYFTGIWLLNEQKIDLVLQASYGGDGSQLFEPGSIVFSLNTAPSIVALVCRTGEYYLANEVTIDPHYRAIEKLPDTRSELALPLQVGRNMIGVLDIHSEQGDAFDSEDKTVLQTLADQIAVAIRNAQLYKLEKKLRQIEEERAYELAELNTSKDKFFSIVSHDLRDPFNGILGNAQLVLMQIEKLSRRDIRRMTQGIYDSAEAAYNVFENLLAWSRMQRGVIECQHDRINVGEFIDNTISLFREMATRKNIQLVNTIPKGIFVYADMNMFDTVARNLISNAIKFTHQGGLVTIAARRDDSSLENRDKLSETPSEFIEISVSDTGVGIGQDHLKRLFELETHYSTPGTMQEQGTGLGLLICKEMVERNEGKIWIESEEDQGTTVRFIVSFDPSSPSAALLKQEWPSAQPEEKGKDGLETQDILTIPAPLDKISLLFDLAMVGDMQGIEEQAAQIEQLSERYGPFADKLRKLARDFEDEKILALVEQYMEADK